MSEKPWEMVIVASTNPFIVRLVGRTVGHTVRSVATKPQMDRVLEERLRLIVFGPDFPVKDIEGVRERAHGVFLAYCIDDRHHADVAGVSQYVDTVIDISRDSALVEDVVRNTVEEHGDPSPWKLVTARVRDFTLVIFGWVVVWWAIVKIFSVPEYLLPAPTVVLEEFLRAQGTYLFHGFVTAAEAGAGFLIGNLFGLVAGIALGRSLAIRRVTLPVFVVSQSIPLIAVAPLLVVWFGSGPTAKIAMATLICFFPMTTNTVSAFGQVDSDAQELFTLYGASYAARLRMLLIPASLPTLVAALRISAGLCVVGAIVAELTGSDVGIGNLLITASYHLDTPALFVGIILAAVLGGIYYLIPGLLLRMQRR